MFFRLLCCAFIAQSCIPLFYFIIGITFLQLSSSYNIYIMFLSYLSTLFQFLSAILFAFCCAFHFFSFKHLFLLVSQTFCMLLLIFLKNNYKSCTLKKDFAHDKVISKEQPIAQHCVALGY